MGEISLRLYGGMAAGMISHCIVVEEFAKADASVALMPSCQELGSLPIILAGNHEQRKSTNSSFNRGDAYAFGPTEAKGGSDVAALKTRAVRKGESTSSTVQSSSSPTAA